MKQNCDRREVVESLTYTSLQVSVQFCWYLFIYLFILMFSSITNNNNK